MSCSFPDGTDQTSIEILGRESSSVDGQFTSHRTHEFSFDRTFKTDSAQENVWAEIKQLCTSAIDGYKVTVFAYGQVRARQTSAAQC